LVYRAGMEVTGYKIREALKTWTLRKTATEQAFPDSLHKFEGDTKESPLALSEVLLQAELSIVRLQAAQMQYNLAVRVEIDKYGITTLAEAIKFAGAADRLEKLWRAVNVTSTKRSMYDSSPELVRDPTQVRAVATIAASDVLKQTTAASKRASAVRAAIASGNATKVNIEDLVPALFE
jgi:hypothetical protein